MDISKGYFFSFAVSLSPNFYMRPLDTVYRILNDMDELFLPYTIALSIFDDISDPEVIDHIQRVGIEFYKKDEAIPELVALE